MWSQLALCLVVGLAYASASAAWKENTEYEYVVNGRTLSSLHEAFDQYSGIIFKCKLLILLRPDGKLQGKIVNPQYAQIQSQLPDGWRSEIPENQLVYKQLTMKPSPFLMELKGGLIKSLIVEKDITNWEANIIKSIVSQFQLDLQGTNIIPSPVNHMPGNNKLDRVFQTMEETVTGETETLYDVHYLPEYLLQSQPWLVPQNNLKRNGQGVIEVTKFKNFTNAESRPSYHYGFGHIDESEPSSNKMGEFFIRESYSRIILTGDLSSYFVQNSYTINKNVINPIFKNKQMGSVVSMMNVTLNTMKTGQQPEELSNPTDIGSLVYTYEIPFSSSNKVHHKLEKHWENDDSSSNYPEEQRSNRFTRSILTSEKLSQEQHKPQLSRVPDFPLLPYMVGYHGKSIKENSDFDLKGNVEKLAKEISSEMEDPEKILSESSLDKYTILNSLIRLMNEDEIKSVAEELYSQNQENQGHLAWTVFRDSVAEAGTGPAFINIKQWIQSKKIEKREASQVICTMTNALRVPTEDYMKKLFELVKSPEVKNQQLLNESAILCYTNLVYRVYVNSNESHNQYPVHVFGSFNTKEGREYIKSTVLPYLSEELKNAVNQGDATKIHVYTRAIGNIGSRQILEVFEDYLEGHKFVSQFQRLWMVICLGRLAYFNPTVARSVFYKIYQNTAELPEIRVAAVYQLMKTNPPVEIMQRMAQYTNTDAQEQVNAAVKSVLVSASRLWSPESRELREAAQSAVPLLTKKQYGADQSYLHLHDYVAQEMEVHVRHQFGEYGSQDSSFPKMLGFDFVNKMHGMKFPHFHFESVISSIRELTNVFYRQTEEFRKASNQRSQEQQNDGSFSSSKVAQLMKYEREEREQLEYIIFSEIEHMQKLWSFDNQTMEQLPEIIRQQEEQLKSGKQFNYAKLRQLQELALSFPTEMGIPFLYTYDVPVLVRLEGKIKATATPQISQKNRIYTPEKIVGDVDTYVTISGKVQSHLSFVTPFDHQIYLAGYDRTLHSHIPFKAQVDIDVKNKQAKVEFEFQEKHEGARLLHFSSTPYTSRSDIMTIRPVALRPNTLIIKDHEKQHRFFDFEFGKKETGLSFRAWGHHPVQNFNLGSLTSMWKSENFVTLWDELWDKATLTYTEASLRFNPKQSTVRKVTFRFKHSHEYVQKPEIEKEEDFLSLSQLATKLQSDEPQERQQELMRHVGSGIKSVRFYSTDISMECEGDEKMQYILGYSIAKSNVGSLSKALVYYKNRKQNTYSAFELRGDVPNTNGLDLTYSLTTEPSAKITCKFQHGQADNKETRISAQVHMTRSKARKQYLTTEDSLYHVCKEQMQEGNFQLPACQYMTIRANFLDDIKYKVQFENLNKRFAEYVDDVFKASFVYYFPMTEFEYVPAEADNTVKGTVQFQPENLHQLNATFIIKDKQYKIYNQSYNSEIVHAVLVPHPVFHMGSRLWGHFRGLKNIRPTCVIDQNVAQTFSNKSYSLSLDKQLYTVVMQYIPKDARWKGDEQQTVEMQLKQQLKNCVILARQTSDNQKEVIISFNHEKTMGKTVEIQMKPNQGKFSGSSPAASVLVDGKQMTFDDKQSADLYDGFVEIYSLPNGEVKIQFHHSFYVIFDGQRIKVTAIDGALRDSIYGLCGRYSEDQQEDFTVPAKCVVRTPEKFTENFQISSKRGRRQHRFGEWGSECVPKILPVYADIISDLDVGRSQSSFQKATQSGTRMLNRYVEENGHICFSIHPLPTCRGSVQRSFTKLVPVHCITATKAAYIFKAQIDQGRSTDFSTKSETMSVNMEVPVQCD
ncbi:vitellogenin-like [Euwallacea fornicatus]|uniref:vitellogenin-like n=1 Tax=Euwallacea fornicatus TaxID=995702 RepID=UPI00338D908C